MANEKDDAKKREEGRAVALKNIESGLWDYALPQFVSFEDYGRISESAKEKYNSLIQKAPSQDVYEQVFYPQLSHEGGAVTSPYIQQTSAAILQESFSMLKVQDILKYLGAKGNLKPAYKDKYVSELDKKEVGALISSCIQFRVNKKVADLFGEQSKAIAGGLEKMLTEEPKEEKK